MTTQTVMSARQFNIYHHDDGLLFQFILAEFIEAYQEIIRLGEILNDLEEPAKKEAIEESWSKLVGCSNESMRFITWNLSNGTLIKLKNYCTLFVQNNSAGNKEAMALVHYADKAWLTSLQGLEFIKELPRTRTELRELIEKIRTTLNRFSKLIVRMFFHFREDENVIFFLVRNYQPFDNLHGAKFVSKLLGRLYPKGCQEARQFIETRYRERGFENMLSIIDKLFTELNASS